eukprot:9216653-Prorocentrum_lima.AAC.1
MLPACARHEASMLCFLLGKMAKRSNRCKRVQASAYARAASHERRHHHATSAVLYMGMHTRTIE